MAPPDQVRSSDQVPRTLAAWLASGGGIGWYAPAAPGTFASLVAVLIGGLALAADNRLLVVLAAAACVTGFWAVRASGETGDPGWIVIDEFAGQWIALLGLGQFSWTGLAGAFLLFRLFDIVKIGPVRWADKQHGAFGVMADDVIAGAIAAVLLYLATALFPRI